MTCSDIATEQFEAGNGTTCLARRRCVATAVRSVAVVGLLAWPDWQEPAFAQGYQPLTEYTVPTAGSTPQGIAKGSDGALWFVETVGNKIGRVTTAGVFSEYLIPTAASNSYFIAAGPDGALWFTEREG